MAYDDSEIDWKRLRSFAKRVAKETRRPQDQPVTYRESGTHVEAIGSHWLLTHRRDHWQQTEGSWGSDRSQETEHYDHYYVLLPSGHLKYCCVTEQETIFWQTARSNTVHRVSHTVRDFIDSDVTVFDYELKSFERKHGSTTTWGQEVGRTRHAHAKGVGLSITLKRILEHR